MESDIRPIAPAHAVGEPLDPFRALADGWRSFLANPWMSLAVVLVLYVIYMAAVAVPFLNLFAAFLLAPALAAGGATFLLRSARGERPEFGTAFDGFRRWPTVTGAILVVQLVAAVIFAPFIVALVASLGIAALLDMSHALRESSAMAALFAGPMLVVAPIVYVLAVWWAARMMPIYFLVLEPEVTGANEALRRAWSLTRGSTWRLVGLFLLALPVGLVGMLALCVGIFPAVVVVYYMFAHGYEQLRARAGEPAAAEPPETPEPPAPVIT